MKKLLALPVSLALLIGVSACADDSPSTNNGPDNAAVEPSIPDLSGTWRQQNTASETDYMEATIAENTITVRWMFNEDDMTPLYWVGTFDVPADATSPVTIESVRDKEATDPALFAAMVDTKDFTYDDGEITFDVSIQDETATVQMTEVESAPAES